MIICEDKKMGNSIKEKPEVSKYPGAGWEFSQRIRYNQDKT